MPNQNKALGFWRGWALVVGGTIGSGIFLMPTILAPYGLMGLIGWLIAGVGAILLSLMLADLSRRIPKIGGPYAYARAGFGDFIGFWIGWGYWISVWSATAAVAVACTGYIGFFVPSLVSNPLLSTCFTLSLIWALTFVNIRSMVAAGQVQLITTILKILPLVFVGILGLSVGSTSNFPEINPSGGNMIAAIATSVTLVMWAFVGLEGGTIPADDIVEPEKTIPRILVLGTTTVLVVYFLAYVGVILLVPADQLVNSTAPFADAVVMVIGGVGASVIAIGAIIATFGTLNTQVLLSGQIVRAVAEDKLFPPRIGKLGSSGTPKTALIISSILASILVIMNYTEGLVAAFTMMILLSTLTTLIPLSFAAVSALMFISKDAPSSQKTGALITALLAFLYSLFVIVGAGAETVFYGFILLMAALPFYALIRRANP
ncbi:MAG: APA family basic amino acid/polyamine antiporter [Candidatus Azotimanducaceae bacterium]|jgi:APA family basic amino acid/polyamine antiporter